MCWKRCPRPFGSGGRNSPFPPSGVFTSSNTACTFVSTRAIWETGEGHMTIEVPVLRLGLAGYTDTQIRTATEVAAAASSPRVGWELGAFAEADAWWLEGSR